MTATFEDDGVRACVRGDLLIGSALVLRDAGRRWIEGATEPSLHLDLSGVGRVSTVAVALLLAWRRAAQRAGVQLSIEGVPPALVDVADFSNVRELLWPEEAVAGDGVAG